MTKKSIFKSEELDLRYSKKNNCFYLNRGIHDEYRRRYDSLQAVYEIYQTIRKEMLRPEHNLGYRLKKFNPFRKPSSLLNK